MVKLGQRQILALLLCGHAYGACVSAANGNWSSGSSWTGCTGVGGIPGTGDAPQIEHVIHIDAGITAINVLSSLVSGSSNGQLIFDGAHPTTFTCSSVTADNDCIEANQGATPIIDTSAGSNTNTLEVVDTALPFGGILISHRSGSALTFNLQHLVLKQGGSNGSGIYTAIGGDTFTISHNDIENMVVAAVQFDGAVAALTASDNYFRNISVSHASIYLHFGFSNDNSIVITDNTEDTPASNHSLVQELSTALTPVGAHFTGNFVTDNASFHLGLLDTNSNAWPDSLVQYNIAHYSTTGGIGVSLGGLSGHPAIISRNVFESYDHGINYGSYVNSDHNVCIIVTEVSQQGCYNGPTTSFDTSRYDIVSLGPNTLEGDIGAFWYGNSGVNSTNVTLDHMTSFGSSADTSTSVGVQIGETGFAVSLAQISNSIVGGWTNGIVSGTGSNSFVTTGTGSVGVFNNNVFNILNGGAAWSNTGSAPNFGSGHPSATYGDMMVNPWLFSTTRTLAQCDGLLGGPGTLADISAQLGGRWNGTQTNAAITPQNLWVCMFYQFTPQNPAIATAASDGSYLGAVPPLVLIGAAQ